ncbi:MAG TPA: hypothetical protein VKY74_00730 [Chloroflexia bacterium]|nr:hypothetical protein [Chloroflexia bacterium]
MDGAATGLVTHSRLFTLPKAGKTEAEYEDAAVVDDATGIYVVADGASDSVFAGLWAQLVAQRFADGLPAASDAQSWRDWLQPAQTAWQTTVHADPLPWYVEPKIRQGAFATCVALILRPAATPGGLGHWGVVAVGDSCLFQISGAHNGTPASRSPAAGGFPISNPAEFGTNPLALCSNPEYNEVVWPHLAHTSGTWQPGDLFILASDAMAHWIMQELVPVGAWDRLLPLLDAADDTAFRALVAAEWDNGLLRNDDLTLLMIRVVSAEDTAVPSQPVTTAAGAS